MTPDQEKLLRDVHTALIGNDMGTTGLVKRMKSVENYQALDKKYKQRAAGGLVVGNLVLVAVWEYIKWRWA